MIVVAAAVLILLGLIYGFGSLFFAWWDGGILRRVLMALCGMALLYGVFDFVQTHTFAK